MSTRRNRRARQLIDRLRPLRTAYPEFSVIIEGSIEDLRHEAKRNPDSDRTLVLSAVHSGLWSISDLLDELPLKRKALQVILDWLVDAGTVITKTPESRGDFGGRPETLYMPAS